jgi:hypothetical protein
LAERANSRALAWIRLSLFIDASLCR